MNILELIDTIGRFNFICGIATLVGTGFTFWQARSAKKSAELAEEAKNAVLAKKRNLDFAAFISESRTIDNILTKWTKERSKGLNYDEDHNKIHDYISNLNSIISQLENNENIDRQYKILSREIKNFKKNQNSIVDESTINAANEMKTAVQYIVRELQSIIKI